MTIIARISKHQIGKYRLENGVVIDAFVLGGNPGYRQVVPVVVTHGQDLTHVEIRSRRGRPVLVQCQARDTTVKIIRINAIDTRLGNNIDQDHGYGTVMVKPRDMSRMKTVASGHVVVSGRKQNDILLAITGDADVYIKPVNGHGVDAFKLVVGSDPGVATRSAFNLTSVEYRKMVDLCRKPAVDLLRF